MLMFSEVSFTVISSSPILTYEHVEHSFVDNVIFKTIGYSYMTKYQLGCLITYISTIYSFIYFSN